MIAPNIEIQAAVRKEAEDSLRDSSFTSLDEATAFYQGNSKALKDTLLEEKDIVGLGLQTALITDCGRYIEALAKYYELTLHSGHGAGSHIDVIKERIDAVLGRINILDMAYLQPQYGSNSNKDLAHIALTGIYGKDKTALKKENPNITLLAYSMAEPFTR